MSFRHLSRILWGTKPQRSLLRAAIIGIIVFFVLKFLAHPIKVRTEAMKPEIQSDQLIVVSPVPYWFQEPKIGDVVAIRLSGASLVYISRIIGLSGQIVRLQNNQLLVDDVPAIGEKLQLPHSMVQTNYESKPIAEDEVFVAGDWRKGSLEEMHAQGSFGRVKKSQILGKLLF